MEALGITPITDWSLNPAISDVVLDTNNITNAGTGFTISNDRGVDIAGGSGINLLAQNGLGGNISLTSETGLGGIGFGSINLTSKGGDNAGITTGGTINLITQCPAGVSTTIGGQINIIAQTGSGAVPTATAKILTNASGILSWAGATSPVTS